VATQRRWGLLLAPGAGAGSEQAGLVAIDRAATDQAFAVKRMGFPYRLAGRRVPDRLEVLVAAVRSAAQSLVGDLGDGALGIFAGGRSMGGRVCSIAAAEGMGVAGLVLVSYPLHPPGKPDLLRTAHFGRIEVPCLFVSGTRDAFGTPAELERATAAVKGAVTLHFVEGADHSLRRRDEEVAEVVLTWLAAATGAGRRVVWRRALTQVERSE
jgi:predicted alpha/beta-hydrolase family hydrolase